MISKVLINTGAKVRACGMIYKVVAQTVLLYGSDSWVVTGEMLKVLEGFHHRVARKIAGMKAWRVEDGEWDYPLVGDFLEAAGICKINEYIQI